MITTDVLAAGNPYPALPHTNEILLGLVAMSVLVWLLAKYAWPLFVKSHEDDTQRIRSGLERAESEQEDAQAELERSRATLAGVDDEAARIRDDARADAERIKQDIARRTDDEAERVRAQGRQSVDSWRARTVSDLRADVGASSVELARRIVSADLADDRRRGESVDRFLAELESMGSGSANSATGPAGTSTPGGSATTNGGGA